MSSRYVAVSAKWCHICGLPIPDNIASSSHALFGTVDHVVPIALGGSRTALRNRRAAHRMCNLKKGSQEISPVGALLLHRHAKQMLEKMGYPITKKAIRRSIGRSLIVKATKTERWVPYPIQVWEGEGGFCG